MLNLNSNIGRSCQKSGDDDTFSIASFKKIDSSRLEAVLSWQIHWYSINGYEFISGSPQDSLNPCLVNSSFVCRSNWKRPIHISMPETGIYMQTNPSYQALSNSLWVEQMFLAEMPEKYWINWGTISWSMFIQYYIIPSHA